MRESYLYNDAAQDVEEARHLISSLIEELAGWDTKYTEDQEEILEILKDESEIVETKLRRQWPAVEALEAVLKETAEVFKVVWQR